MSRVGGAEGWGACSRGAECRHYILGEHDSGAECRHNILGVHCRGVGCRYNILVHLRSGNRARG